MDHSIPPYETRFEDRLDSARLASHAVDNAILDSRSRDEIISYLVHAYAADTVTLITESLFAETHEPPTIAGQPVPSSPLPFELHLIITCTGAAQALLDDNPPVTSAMFGSQYTLTRVVELGSDFSPAHLRALKDDWLDEMDEAVSRANASILSHRAELRAAVTEIVGQRHERRAALVAAAAEMMIPLTPVLDHPIHIPLYPQHLTLESANKAADTPSAESALAEDIANDLISLIDAFSRSLERTPTTATKLIGEDEETIRDVLLFILNANWKGTATGETFVGKGKTDILLRWKDRDAFIGECKIWKGEALFESGLTQLLERYTVWRATRVAMILFVRNVKDVTAIINKAQATIRNHSRFVEEVADTEPPAFKVRAQSDASRIVTLHLVPVVLPSP